MAQRLRVRRPAGIEAGMSWVHDLEPRLRKQHSARGRTLISELEILETSGVDDPACSPYGTEDFAGWLLRKANGGDAEAVEALEALAVDEPGPEDFEKMSLEKILALEDDANEPVGKSAGGWAADLVAGRVSSIRLS